MADAVTLEFPALHAAPHSNGELLARAADLLRPLISVEPGEGITPIDPDDLLADADAAPWSAFARLCERFELDRFEAGLLLTLAAIAVDPPLAATCAALQGMARSGTISFAFATRLLPDARLAALRPDAPLRLRRLVELEAGGDAISVIAFRIDQRVLFYLAGAELAPELLDPLAPADWLAPSQVDMAERLAGLLDPDDPAGGAAIQLCGSDAEALRAIAGVAVAAQGLAVHRLPAAAVPTQRSEQVALAQRCSRDLALAGAVLLIEASSPDAAAASFAALVEAPVLVAADKPLALAGRASLRLDVPDLSVAERSMHWRALVPGLEPDAIALVARTFLLDSSGRSAAARRAGSQPTIDELWQACREQARDRLEGLAQRIVSWVEWEDLVLPDSQQHILRDVVDHVALAEKVFDEWHFADRQSRGTGVAALFAGPSGTGKTLAAEVLANALRRDLYRIDLSQVVSKYIGETEKNLATIFSAAETGGAILLFDEADALFGKRSEVQDAHDRYANIEVSYLLQRMETYGGLSILTTNLRDSLDKAFLRRLRFIVQFAYPNADQRQRIWERAFPAQLPRAGIDYRRLGQLDLTGGGIRNVALAAAFLAARDGGPLTMEHCLAAAMREYQKLEKPLSGRELGGRGR